MYDKMAVIGDKDSVFAFKAVGVDVFGASDAEEAKAHLKAVQNDYKVIFITEDLAEALEEQLKKYRSSPYPAIIPIPRKGKGSGYAMRGLRSDMEKAIGADILGE